MTWTSRGTKGSSQAQKTSALLVTNDVAASFELLRGHKIAVPCSQLKLMRPLLKRWLL